MGDLEAAPTVSFLAVVDLYWPIDEAIFCLRPLLFISSRRFFQVFDLSLQIL